MLILSNSLSVAADEGSLKLATNIVKRIKQQNSDGTFVVSFNRETDISDVHIELNKFHISKQLVSIIKNHNYRLLYIPFPASSFSMAIRIFMLSLFARKGLQVCLIRQYDMSRLTALIINLSRAQIVVFSKKACDFYRKIVNNHILYLKSGVNTQKFTPVSSEKVKELKTKYGFNPDVPIILHVGHMKDGRNISKLMDIDEKYQVLLVTSTLSKERQNENLKNKLLSCSNIRIMDNFIPNIEEIYQMCDLYFFPVVQMGHCIDIPLSCLEAAACDKPVITTDFGEMQEFVEKNGFYFINDLNKENINRAIEYVISEYDCGSRDSVLEYDFDNSINRLVEGFLI